GNRTVVGDGNLRIQGLSLVCGDGEYEERVRSSPGSVGGYPAGLLGKRSRKPGDYESLAADLLNHYLQYPEPLLGEQVQPLADVNVHAQPANALADEPVSVSSERLLVDR